LEGWVKEAARSNPSIRFLGWLKMEDLLPVIEQADLIPSLYEPRTKNAEIATPGKLLTAMSLSIPSLVPAGTYQAEIVSRYRCGLVVDWNDPAKVREAISTLAADGLLYGRLSIASYQAFRSSFSWEEMCSNLGRFYAHLVGPEPREGTERRGT
jgi:glycosyltransferase involved in cell wall biosynthesis